MQNLFQLTENFHLHFYLHLIIYKESQAKILGLEFIFLWNFVVEIFKLINKGWDPRLKSKKLWHFSI